MSNNQKITVDAPELHPIPVHSPWFHLGIDFIGPVTQSANGNHFILTVSDYFTKWVEAVALPSKCACGIANSLFKVSYSSSYIYTNFFYRKILKERENYVVLWKGEVNFFKV